MIDWMDVNAKQTVAQDVRVSLSLKGDSICIAIKRGVWITKLHRADKLAVGFSTNNGMPTAMYFAPNSSGYAVLRKDGKSTSVGLRLRSPKIQEKYPRLKLSELQGDYILREDKNENACFISLGAKSY